MNTLAMYVGYIVILFIISIFLLDFSLRVIRSISLLAFVIKGRRKLKLKTKLNVFISLFWQEFKFRRIYIETDYGIWKGLLGDHIYYDKEHIKSNLKLDISNESN